MCGDKIVNEDFYSCTNDKHHDGALNYHKKCKDNDDEERKQWLESHFILVQSACETESKERFHTGLMYQ